VPFPGQGNLNVLRKKLQSDFVPPRRLVPSLGEHIERVICRALDAAPERRQSSCREFIDALGAETAAAEAPALRPEDRRTAPRFPAALDASCWPLRETKERWQAKVQDISLTGIRLELDRRFEPGTTLSLEVSDTEQESMSLWLVRVRWVRAGADGKWGIGCVFTSPLGENDLNVLLENRTPTVVVQFSGGPTHSDVAGALKGDI